MKNIKVSESITQYIKTGCCKPLRVTLMFNGNEVNRIMLKGEEGGCKGLLMSLSELLSFIAKMGNEHLKEAIDKLKGIECKGCVDRNGNMRNNVEALSCGDAISKLINIEIKKETKQVNSKMEHTDIKDLRSVCCNAKVKTSGMLPDFIGDKPETQKVGTVHFICTKCEKDCNTK